MEELLELYNKMGISPAVYNYGEKTLERLNERFSQIDKIAEHNQAKAPQFLPRSPKPPQW